MASVRDGSVQVHVLDVRRRGDVEPHHGRDPRLWCRDYGDWIELDDLGQHDDHHWG